MARTQTKLLGALAVLSLAAIGATVAYLVTDAPTPVPTEAAATPSAAAPRAVPDETLQTAEKTELSGLSGAPSQWTGSAVGTTVAWPVRVELELVRGAHLPKAKDAAPMGSGATARFKGRLVLGEAGIHGKVTFTSGANAGRVLECNEVGEFGANDLYPGLAEVRVEGPGIESYREVRLRREQTEELNISYDRPGQFAGKVFDREGKPLETVDVELDGQHALTDAEGVFSFASAIGGDAVQLVLRKKGYATVSSRVAVAAGRAADKDRYTFTLGPAATLEIVLGSRVGSRDDSVVLISPEIASGKRSYPDSSYPWHRVSPARAKPGTPLVFDDLPAMRLTVRVFHDGAVAEPESATIFLQPGQTVQHAVRFEPAPSLHGRVVTADGRRVDNARVTCEAPDRVGATLQYLAAKPTALEEDILPTFPPAASETRTNFNGEFELSTWPKFGATRYLWAQSADGKLWGGRAVHSDEKEVELVVAPVEEGRASLALEFPARNQGLPVVVVIGGKPREEVIVPADAPLVLDGLAFGTWRAKAAWNGRALIGGVGYEEFELTGDQTRSFSLPLEAIVGQDADTLLRAGRPVPTSAAPVGGKKE